MRILLAASLALLPALAQAATVESCAGDYRSSVQAVAEPWEANTRTFANGAIRLVVTDTIEPAVASFHLVILHPPYDEVGGGQCTLISAPGGMGFSGLSLGPADASYDPARGLTVNVPASLYNQQTGGFDDRVLSVTINQATGGVTAQVR